MVDLTPSIPRALLTAAACEAGDLARWQREGEALDEAAIEAICLRAVPSKSCV